MKKHYLVFFLALLVQCGNILGEYDKTEILPDDLIGEWVRVVQNVISTPMGTYAEIDSVTYRIGIDKVRDSIPITEQPRNAMTFHAEGKYTRNSIFGNIYQPYEDYYGKNEYDYDLSIPFIRFKLLQNNRTKSDIRFAYTRDFPKDTIVVTIDSSEPFGLKRRGL